MIGDDRWCILEDVIDALTLLYFVIHSLSPLHLQYYLDHFIADSRTCHWSYSDFAQFKSQIKYQPKIAKTIRLIQLIYLLSLFILTMPKLPTLITGALPAPQQPNPLPLGHIYIRSQPSTQFSLPSPTFKSNDKPAFEVREVAYSVFYPSEPKWKGKKWVPWVIEPTKGVLEGYEKFIGKSGLGWMCEC
jgi:hypothetical protein